MRCSILILALSTAAGTSLAMAQMPGEAPTYVSVSDLTERSSYYNDRLVRVVGDLENSDYADTQNRIYVLRGDSGLDRIRVGMPAGSTQSLTFNVGRRVEIRGVFWDLSGFNNSNRVRDFPGALREDDVSGVMEGHLFIGVFEVTRIEEEEAEPERAEDVAEPRKVTRADLPDSDTVDLRELVRNPEPYYDKLVTVVGKFRGDNVYNDLSMRTKKTPRDFIIKVADTAIDSNANPMIRLPANSGPTVLSVTALNRRMA